MPSNPRAPLRLLLVARRTIPNWLRKCLHDVERSGAGGVALVLRTDDDGGRAWRTVDGLRHILFWLHERLDRRLFRRHPDALAPTDLGMAFPTAPLLRSTDRAPASVLRALDDEGFDVVLDPFACLPDGLLDDRASGGVWRITFGRSGDPQTQSTPGFWEVVEGGATTETRLCVRASALDGPRSIYLSVAPSDRRSMTRSQNHVYWKVAAALARQLLLLWEDPDRFLTRLKAAPAFHDARDRSQVPGNGAVLRAWTALTRRYVADKWLEARYREHWALAACSTSGAPSTTPPFRTLLPPIDREWADPFPVKVGNEYYVFHEEMPFATSKGSIVATVLDDTAGTLERAIPVLDQDCHLSYPFVFQWEGEYFMTPETASRNQVELYRCVNFPAQWRLERVLLTRVRAYDPTPVLLFGRWWLFANVATYGAGTTDELQLFCADSPLGPWTPHRGNPIKSDVRAGRPAGRVFERQGQFFRPAQDCSKHYGYALSINRILRLDEETYEELEVDKILPDWAPGVVGIHTFNRSDEFTTIDCLVRRPKRRRATLVASPP